MKVSWINTGPHRVKNHLDALRPRIRGAHLSRPLKTHRSTPAIIAVAAFEEELRRISILPQPLAERCEVFASRVICNSGSRAYASKPAETKSKSGSKPTNLSRERRATSTIPARAVKGAMGKFSMFSNDFAATSRDTPGTDGLMQIESAHCQLQSLPFRYRGGRQNPRSQRVERCSPMHPA